MKSNKEKYLRIVSDLIHEGNQVVGTKFDSGLALVPTHVDLQVLHRWWGKIKSFAYQLGVAVTPWKDILNNDPERNTLSFVRKVIGTLEAIKYEIENDHLESFARMVQAETAADLMEQSESLLNKGYYLAAGVIGRAILEEILRKTCERLNCMPSKDKPTINDFNQSLYGFKHYSVIRMKQIEALAAIGNNAAHNSTDLKKGDVERFINELPALIEDIFV